MSIMPDERLELPVDVVEGVWRQQRIAGSGMLRLGAESIELAPAAGEWSVQVHYDTLSGVSWRTGTLAVHAPQGTVVMHGGAALQRAWVTIVRGAAAVPEFTRGLRAMGSRRGGDSVAQGTFFAPLLHARRLLEEEADLARRIALFDAAVLRAKLNDAIAALAALHHPVSAPDRRALDAELHDAAEPLYAALEALSAAAARFRDAAAERQFVAWREWVAAVAAVFAAADRAWSGAVPLLPASPAQRRRTARGRPAMAWLTLSLGVAPWVLR